MKTQITQQRDGIIIVDVVTGLRSALGTESTSPLQIPVRVDKMDFEFENGDYHIIDIGNSTLTPTIKTDVAGFNFDESARKIEVLDASGQSVYTTSTDNRVVQLRINFRTASITVYE